MRTTITINDKLFRTLKMRVAERVTRVYLSWLRVPLNTKYSEDFEDAVEREHESAHSFDDLVRKFKAEGLL